MKPQRWLRALPAAWFGVLVSTTAINAQVNPDSLRNMYRLKVPTEEQASTVVLEPAVTAILTPGSGGRSGFDIWAGVTYVPRVRYEEDGGPDGNAVIGVDFGNARRLVGIDIDVGFYSTMREGLFKRMGLNVELYRYVPYDLLLTVGWENVWSRGYSDIGTSRYIALGRWFEVRPGATWFRWIGLTAGAGDGRFVSEGDWLAGVNRINWFGAVRFAVLDPVTLTLDWQGDDLTIATTLQPFRRLDFWITPAITDATGRISTGARFIISAGYSHQIQLPF